MYSDSEGSAGKFSLLRLTAVLFLAAPAGMWLADLYLHPFPKELKLDFFVAYAPRRADSGRYLLSPCVQ